MDAVYFACFNQHYSVSAEPGQGHCIKPATADLIQSETHFVFYQQKNSYGIIVFHPLMLQHRYIFF